MSNSVQNENDKPTKLALIASKGTLDWGYPPFILASAGAVNYIAVFIVTGGLAGFGQINLPGKNNNRQNHQKNRWQYGSCCLFHPFPPLSNKKAKPP